MPVIALAFSFSRKATPPYTHLAIEAKNRWSNRFLCCVTSGILFSKLHRMNDTRRLKNHINVWQMISFISVTRWINFPQTFFSLDALEWVIVNGWRQMMFWVDVRRHIFGDLWKNIFEMFCLWNWHFLVFSRFATCRLGTCIWLMTNLISEVNNDVEKQMRLQCH